MTPSPFNSTLFERLLIQLTEFGLQPREELQLVGLLQEHEPARRLYVAHLMLHGELGTHFTASRQEAELDILTAIKGLESPSSLDLLAQPTAQPAPESFVTRYIYPTFNPRSIFLSTGVLLATVAFWAVLAFLLVPKWRGKYATEPLAGPTAIAVNADGSIGQMVRSDGCKWQSSEMPTSSGAQVMPGRLHLLEGTAEIALEGGVTAVIDGPTVLELISPKKAFLNHGKISARVSAEGVGFTVNTPSAVIVDLGTEFDVEVGKSGTTDVRVTHGNVEVAPATSLGPSSAHGPVRVSAGEAIRIDRRGVSQKFDAEGTAKDSRRQSASPFLHIDLADIVAGGDGSRHRRGSGIHPVDGRRIYAPSSEAGLSIFGNVSGSGEYCKLVDRLIIDGVSIPNPQKGPVQLDSAGHVFAGFPQGANVAYGPIWAGSVPFRIAHAKHFGKFITTFDGKIDYGVAPHNSIALIPSKLVTFDLAAIRRIHPQKNLREFRTMVGVTRPPSRAPKPELADIWVFVDGELQASRRAIDSSHGPEDVVVPLEPDARHLTLAATASGSRLHVAWVLFGDPRIEFEASEQQSVIAPNSTGK
jgi:hypothetical protein